MNIEKLFEEFYIQVSVAIETLGIPRDAYREYGASAFEMSVFEIGDADKKAGAQNRFDLLCQSAPHVPMEALKALSMASGAASVVSHPGLDSDETIATALMSAAMSVGFGIGIYRARVKTAEERKKLLSTYGLKGIAEKNKGPSELKAWAIAEAKNIRADDMSRARKLAANLPAHLVNVSKNPERLIYDALRLERANTAS